MLNQLKFNVTTINCDQCLKCDYFKGFILYVFLKLNFSEKKTYYSPGLISEVSKKIYFCFID